MIRDAQFDAALSLARLQVLLNNYEMLWGTLTAIGSHDGVTIGSYDDARPGSSGVVLRPGPAAAKPGETVIDTNTVLVLGQPQRATAYRRAAGAATPSTAPSDANAAISGS